MPLIFLTFVSALLMESLGTYISVVGLGSLFGGDVVIQTIAVTFDVVKFIFITVLYQQWKFLPRTMKYFMVLATLVFMTISSAGNFGYLSAAFQKALAPNMAVTLKVEEYNKERDMLIGERADLQKQIAQINEQIMKEEDPKRKQSLIWSFRSETRRIGARIPVVSKRIDALNELTLKTESEHIESNVHAGPITYVAKAFHIPLEDASLYVILIIVFVFDTSAVMLVLTGNFLIKKRHETKDKQPLRVNPYFVPPEPEDDPDTDSTEPPPPFPDEPEPKPQPQVESPAPPTPQGPKRMSRRKSTKVTPKEQPAPEVVEAKPAEVEPLRASAEERAVLSKVYDHTDTGEAPEEVTAIAHDLILERRVQDYVPIDPEKVVSATALVPEAPAVQTPVIDVFTEGSYSGTPQTGFIDSPMKSSLESVPQVESHPLLYAEPTKL